MDKRVRMVETTRVHPTAIANPKTKASCIAARVASHLPKLPIVDENQAQSKAEGKRVATALGSSRIFGASNKVSTATAKGNMERITQQFAKVGANGPLLARERNVVSTMASTRTTTLALAKREDEKNKCKELSKKPQQPLQPTIELRYGGGNTLMPVELADDIDSYLRYVEEKHALPAEFIAHNQEAKIDGRMRAILVDWFISVQTRFSLHDETLYLAVWILDRVLLQMPVSKANLQLVGLASLFLASKFEEIMLPNVADFVYVAADAFTVKDIIEMEQRVLHTLKFQFSTALAVQFLRRYQFFLKLTPIAYGLAKFIAQVALVAYPLCHLKPSLVAAVAMWLAAYVLNSKLSLPQGHATLADIVHVDEKHLAALASDFVPHVLQMAEPNGRYQALYKKHARQTPVNFTTIQAQRMKRLLNRP